MQMIERRVSEASILRLIGYLSDMPAVVATTKRSVAPINLVANTGLSDGQRCNVTMVRADAPK